MPPVVSASSLVRNCGLVRKLKKERKPTPAQVAAMDDGTLFHRLVETWVKGEADEHEEAALTASGKEPEQWFSVLQSSWTPPDGIKAEGALGLSHDGEYMPVIEAEPHVYVSDEPGLLTAGRADLVWPAPHDPSTIVVADLKTGRWPLPDPGSLLQLMSLGLAAASMYGSEFLRLGIYYARDAAWEWSELIDLAAERERMFEEVKAAALLDESPRPGPWCSGCWERKCCKFASVSRD